MSKAKKEEQMIEETKSATEKLDMWATAMGLSPEDIKKLKIGAIQDLVEEAEGGEKNPSVESDTAKLIEKISSGEFGFSTASGSCIPSYGGSYNTLSTMLPYLMMLSTLHSYTVPQPVTVHIHVDK